MKVTKVKTTPLAIPFRESYYYSHGVAEGINVVLVEVETDEGITGVGEACGDRSAEAILGIVRAAARLLEGMGGLEDAEVVAHLAGVRPLSADRMPLIGPVPGWDGVYLATGHGTKGIHLSAITGRILADLVVRGDTEVSVPVDAFSPLRFAYLM